ncbi:MAG: DMT family transporter [Eubacteriales bacterium]|nr:DMT family transporter [Eubacteriales bacterium]
MAEITNRTGKRSSNWGLIPMALTACFMWGSAFPAIKNAYRLLGLEASNSSGILLFAGLRFIAAAAIVFLFSVVIPKTKIRVHRNAQLELFSYALLSISLTYFFFYRALSHGSGGKLSIINASSAFVAIILSYILGFERRLRPQIVWALILGFSAILLIHWQAGLSLDFRFEAEGAMFAAASTSAVATLWSKTLLRRVDAFSLCFFQLGYGGLVLAGIGLLLGGRFTLQEPLSALSLLNFVWLPLISSVAFTLFTLALGRYPVSQVQIFKSTIPFFSTFLSAWLLKEPFFTVKNSLALCLVIVSIMLIHWPIRGGGQHVSSIQRSS